MGNSPFFSTPPLWLLGGLCEFVWSVGHRLCQVGVLCRARAAVRQANVHPGTQTSLLPR